MFASDRKIRLQNPSSWTRVAMLLRNGVQVAIRQESVPAVVDDDEGGLSQSSYP